MAAVHGHAINYVVSGAKHWFLIPPAHAFYSRKPIGEWIKKDLPGLVAAGVPILRCVQTAGTIGTKTHDPP